MVRNDLLKHGQITSPSLRRAFVSPQFQTHMHTEYSLSITYLSLSRSPLSHGGTLCIFSSPLPFFFSVVLRPDGCRLSLHSNATLHSTCLLFSYSVHSPPQKKNPSSLFSSFVLFFFVESIFSQSQELLSTAETHIVCRTQTHTQKKPNTHSNKHSLFFRVAQYIVCTLAFFFFFASSLSLYIHTALFFSR